MVLLPNGGVRGEKPLGLFHPFIFFAGGGLFFPDKGGFFGNGRGRKNFGEVKVPFSLPPPRFRVLGGGWCGFFPTFLFFGGANFFVFWAFLPFCADLLGGQFLRCSPRAGGFFRRAGKIFFFP